jgi:hypothetical protein
MIVARFAPIVPLALKLFWMHPMEDLGDMGHAKSQNGPFGGSVSVSAR